MNPNATPTTIGTMMMRSPIKPHATPEAPQSTRPMTVNSAAGRHKSAMMAGAVGVK